jgi:hypothetical protein
MHIHMEQTGGLMGRKVSVEIDTSDLTTEEAETLRQVLADANFFALPENMVNKPVPDELQYVITVETDNLVHSVQTSDTTATHGLRTLIQNLSQHSRPIRAKKE